MPAEGIEDPGLVGWINAVDACWRRRGIGTEERARLRAELESDLRQALDSGAAVGELTAISPGEFADHLAQAHDLASGQVDRGGRSVEPGYRSLTLTTLLGALGAAAFLWFFVYPSGVVASVADGSGVSDFWAVMAVHVVSVALTVAAACAAVTWRFGDDPTIRRTVTFLAPLLVLAGGLSVGPTMGLALLFGYSSAVPAVTLEVLLVSAFLVPAIWLARWLALRTGRA